MHIYEITSQKSGHLPFHLNRIGALPTTHFNYEASSSAGNHENCCKRCFGRDSITTAAVTAGPGCCQYICDKQEGRLFQSWYPDTFTEIFGRQNVGSIHGFMYKYIKSLILSLFGVESLKEHLLPEINRFAHTTLTSWSGQPSIEVKDATAAMIFELTAKKLISYDPITCSSSNLREKFVAFIEGLISFPINIPGTAYYKCIQGRKNAMRVLKKMIEQRRSSPERRKGDFFDRVIDELQKDRSMLTEATALDLIFVLLFASYETTSLALTMAIKYLSEHPQVLDKLTSLVAGKKKN
ncbi:cytochrome P450 87A3 isoform X1 [Cinnamomum micranthum f. kanehirae]|uniref:Cytochrome P450 87A3 isoform X1 n=1 Tax=Cinnamomum micranthum f. kanehirae TaxID=337451 RepID=A0A443PW78_9MAGN|nr:cytochrome P450 87A3 isoform X1 [Cinnamomum micranthum f. kanehirae]